MLDPV